MRTEPSLPTFTQRRTRHARHARRTHRTTFRSFLSRHADAILLLWSCLLIAGLVILALT